LSASASSGLTVTFTSNNISVCTVSGVNITIVGAGTCSITASQAGNASYAPAASITQTFLVTATVSLAITKTHTGKFIQATTGVYTIAVSNGASASASSGTITVAEMLPAGLTLASMTGPGWSCLGSTCSRGDSLAPGSSFPPITVTTSIASNAQPQVTNQASVSGGGSSGAIASDVTTIGPQTGTPDVALGKTATQSSTWPGAVASLAVDGNVDGVFNDNSVSSTDLDTNAWWQVDLGSSYTMNSIVIWNRTDCCQSRLSDYWVFVSDTPFESTDTPTTLQARAGTYSSHQTSAPSPAASIVISGAEGRYVRIQLSDTDYLSLAEVQVFGQ
jgi:hypothetical protein